MVGNTRLWSNIANGTWYVAVKDSVGAVNYSSVVVNCTTTTTTTAAPTSANIYINNQMFNGDITDVTVNGVSISGVTFPITIGNGGTGTTSYIGTYDIQVYYSGVTPLNSHIDCIDSNSTDTCTNISGGGSYVFTNQVIDGITDINIIANDSSC
jgi:hypothetical protein